MNNFQESLLEALEQLWHHKLRTFLTLLGMIFGVGAVIAMISVGEGAEKEALKLIDSMGVRNLIIEEKKIDVERLKEVRKHSVGLSLYDVQASLETLPFVTNQSSEKSIEVHTLFSQHANGTSEVIGVSNSFRELSRLTLLEGRWFNENDEKQYRQVAVLAQGAANELFPRGNAIGQSIKVNHLWLQVVGVLEDKLLSKDSFQGVSLGGDTQRIYLPLQTTLKRFKFKALASEIDRFKLELTSDVSPQLAAVALSHLLDRRHAGEKDYQIIVPAALLNQHKETQRIFNIIMSCVAGISLLVGGIGIMNIMLATVLERTKEIGLLRAIGATRSDIKTQFIIESFTISALGGLLGIVLGFILATIISTFAGWPVAWSFSAVLISVVFCAAIGLIFGLYPAIKASKLDPIVALQRD
ncbi:MAG: ABC transporter permease [Psychrobium sp.]|nr:ABC transporter permease [Psychrobium sp.]